MQYGIAFIVYKRVIAFRRTTDANFQFPLSTFHFFRRVFIMKINALICLLALSLLILPSCNNNTNSVSSSEPTSENISGLTSTQSTAQSENTGEQRFDGLSKKFIHPAEVMTFDMETSDPSNDKEL